MEQLVDFSHSTFSVFVLSVQALPAACSERMSAVEANLVADGR